MKTYIFVLAICLVSLMPVWVTAQSTAPPPASVTADSLSKKPVPPDSDYVHQRDVIDVLLLILHKNLKTRTDTAGKKKKSIYFSGAPSITFSEVTKLGVVVAANAAFYTSEKEGTYLSSVLFSGTVTENKQVIIPLQSSLWTKGNKYNLVGDWRYLQFPEDTYGLGGYTTLADGYKLNYNYIRFYQYFLKRWAKDFYAGLGYQMDYHYDIEQLGVSSVVTPYDKYGFNTQSFSSGVSLDVLYDTRKNSINPEGGSFYSNMILRQNLTALGSDQNWTSLLLDVRKYFSLPGSSRNVLAFWSYDWLTLSGNPPYLDLPSTAWDTYDNTGRGYIQSRFRSKDMLDLEVEYRYGILRNGLLGGVVFANAESFSQIGSGCFETVAPAAGFGIRVKFNKFSKTNIALDYAFGLNNNNGIFLNLGEVF